MSPVWPGSNIRLPHGKRWVKNSPSCSRIGTILPWSRRSTPSTQQDGRLAGLLTCTNRELAYLTVLHYSPAGSVYPVYRQLLVPAQQTTTLTIEYRQGDTGGVVRLVLWRQKPAEGWVELLATQPNWTGEAVPGVVAERWFNRPKQANNGELPSTEDWRVRPARLSFSPQLGPRCKPRFRRI